MVFMKRIFTFRQYFSTLLCVILVIFCHNCAFSNASPGRIQEANVVHVEIKSIDLPTFQTGETGPLSGRVVLKVLCKQDLPLSASASVKFEDQQDRPEAAVRTIYPGVSSTLDFPLELTVPHDEDDFLSGELRIDVGGQWSLNRQVFIYVRSHGMFFRTYRSRLDDTVYPYALYLPRGIKESSEPQPLVLSLHGAWSNHANNLKRVMGRGNRPGEPDELPLVSLPIWPELPRIDGIVVCPWGRGTMGYHGPGAQDVLDVLELVLRQYPVDPERISVTGLSMGGNGTWEMALHHADLFAAAVPVCAPVDFKFTLENPPDYRKWLPLLERIEEINQVSNFAWNAHPLKIRIHHGTDDPAVPFSHSEHMAKVLTGLGIEAPLTGYDNVGHNSWDPTYKEAETLKWLMSQRRAKPGREISFTAGRYENAKYEWVEVKRFTEYGIPAKVDVSYTQSASRLTLETTNVSLLELDLSQLPGLTVGESVQLVSPQGKKLLNLRVPSEGFVSLEIRKGKLKLVDSTAGENGPVKRKGLEGPIYGILCDRVVLVYGTRGAEAGSTLEQLKKFADWGDLPDVHFIIKPDTAVDDEEIGKSHLVLFGDPGNNSLLARINDKSPVRIQGEKVLAEGEIFQTADVAFKCAFPNPLNPDRLVLWNYNEEWDYTQRWFYRNHFEMLPDYFIYRRGGDCPYATEVLKAGFFDGAWQWK